MRGFDVWFAGWMWVLWLLALLAILPFIWRLYYRSRDTRPRKVGETDVDTTASGEELLKERYERGEISREELETHRKGSEGEGERARSRDAG